MRIEESELADRPSRADRARRVSDDPDAGSINRGDAASGDRPPDSGGCVPSSASRAERSAVYRAEVDAVYRQHAIDHGTVRVRKERSETTAPAISSLDTEDPKSHTADVGDDEKSERRSADAAELKKGDDPYVPESATAITGSRPASVGDNDWGRGRVNRPEHRSERNPSSRVSALVQDWELPLGYTSSPALRRDPYHADSVAARSAANQELYAPTSRDLAGALGYTTRIPAQKVHFDSHGQEVFTNGTNYITPDVDGHNVSDGWKMFNRRGVRIGTYDSELNYVKE